VATPAAAGLSNMEVGVTERSGHAFELSQGQVHDWAPLWLIGRLLCDCSVRRGWPTASIVARKLAGFQLWAIPTFVDFHYPLPNW
jgi:hypothetical protein